ncbi:MAG: 50S ribosomal protein L9 [Dehalococcoidales bacterium]|nr:50S ribosomal protein L9 [Dehalococcoidales bacterium]
MKVIFIEDVPKVARVGETKTVADGYARNYLLPHRLAVVADSQAAKAADKEMKRKMQQRELEAGEMSKLAKKIEGTEITLKAKVGDNEKLYGSITAADIAEGLSKVAGYDIDKKKIELAEPIRQVGSYDVVVRFMWDVIATVKVNVISDAPPVAVKKVRKAEETKPAAEADAAEAAEAPADEAAAEAPEEEEPKAEVVVDMPEIDEAVEDLAEEIEAEIEEK